MSFTNSMDIDPYFFLNVTPDDDINFVTKMFRKKAKRLHPDKNYFSSEVEKNNAREQFHLLIQCYEYILSNHNKSDSFDLKNGFSKESSVYSSSPTSNKNYSENISFGYGVSERLSNLEQYHDNTPSIYQLFTEKNFNVNQFNSIFEYQNKKQKKQKQNCGLVHKTSDGFTAYNSGNLPSCSVVHTYNGVLISGDDFGESGLGYFSSNYSDLKYSFNSSRNPTSIPSSIELKMVNNKQPAQQRQVVSLDYSQVYTEISNQQGQGQSNLSFTEANTFFEQKKAFDLLESIEQDKKFVLKRIDQFPQKTIDAANKKSLKQSVGNFDDTFNPHLSIQDNLSLLF